MARVLPDLWYTRTHEWIRINGDIVEIGLTDYARQELGELVYAEAVPEGRRITSGQAVGSVESYKTAADLYSPVSGVVCESNSAIGQQLEALTADPFNCWFVRIAADALPAAGSLLDAAAYEQFCQGG